MVGGRERCERRNNDIKYYTGLSYCDDYMIKILTEPFEPPIKYDLSVDISNIKMYNFKFAVPCLTYLTAKQNEFIIRGYVYKRRWR